MSSFNIGLSYFLFIVRGFFGAEKHWLVGYDIFIDPAIIIKSCGKVHRIFDT